MGLDITAYSKIKKLDCEVDDDGEPVNYTGEYTRLYPHTDFPERAKTLEDTNYFYDKELHLFSRCYSTYNYLREQLAQLVCKKSTYKYDGTKCYAASYWNGKKGPFSELINFSDCEGCFDTKNCKKLSKDFAKFQEKANSTNDEAFINFYNNLRKMFELASDDGAVRFS
jgi:hypothetical protein